MRILLAFLIFKLISFSVMAQESNDLKDETDIQKLIEDAQAYSTLRFNPEKKHVIKNTLIIDKPITIDGLNGFLTDSL